MGFAICPRPPPQSNNTLALTGDSPATPFSWSFLFSCSYVSLMFCSRVSFFYNARALIQLCFLAHTYNIHISRLHEYSDTSVPCVHRDLVLGVRGMHWSSVALFFYRTVIHRGKSLSRDPLDEFIYMFYSLSICSPSCCILFRFFFFCIHIL